MFRKMIALLLIFAMLVPFSSAAAADEPSESRSMEEILDEYHRRAFEARTQSDTAAASTWSLRGGKTLEEETVDALTNAGYEAYNVTSGNYDSLEADLKTDFAAMGLDPEGSYIIVISGEDPTDPTSNGGVSTYNINPLPGEDLAPGDGNNTVFEYTFEGITYKMRYLTIIPTLSNGMEEYTYSVAPDMFLENTFHEIISSSLISLAEAGIEESFEKYVPLGLIFSMIKDWYTDENLREIEPGTITILADCSWYAQIIQIWTEHTNSWDTSQISERVQARAYLTRLVADPKTGDSERILSDPYKCNHFSPKYFNTSQRILEAIDQYDRPYSGVARDCIYEIDFYFRNATGEIMWSSNGKPLFTIGRDYSVPLHSPEQ